MTERITLQRLVEDDDGVTKTWPDLATLWAAVDPLGAEGYRFRMRYRADLVSAKDAEPAMRVVYGDRVLDVDDITETVRRTEVTITARGRQIDSEDLASGARRKTSWPA